MNNQTMFPSRKYTSTLFLLIFSATNLTGSLAVPVCPSVDGTQAFIGFPSVYPSNWITKCLCADTTCSIGKACNASGTFNGGEFNGRCDYLPCPNTNGTKRFEGFREKNGKPLSQWCKCGDRTNQFGANCRGGEACNAALGKCTIPPCPNIDGTKVFTGFASHREIRSTCISSLGPCSNRCSCGTYNNETNWSGSTVCAKGQHCTAATGTCSQPACPNTDGTKVFAGFTTTTDLCSCGNGRCAVGQLCTAAGDLCLPPPCPNQDGTKVFVGFKDAGKAVGGQLNLGTTCQCGNSTYGKYKNQKWREKECSSGQMCKIHTSTGVASCGRPACPNRDNMKVYVGIDIMTPYETRGKAPCQCDFNVACDSGESCSVDPNWVYKRNNPKNYICRVPTCPTKNGSKTYDGSNGDACLCKGNSDYVWFNSKYNLNFTSINCGKGEACNATATDPNALCKIPTCPPNGDSTKEPCTCGANRCQAGAVCVAGSCVYPSCPNTNGKQIYVGEGLCQCGNRACQTGQMCDASEDKCSDPQCEENIRFVGPKSNTPCKCGGVSCFNGGTCIQSNGKYQCTYPPTQNHYVSTPCNSANKPVETPLDQCMFTGTASHFKMICKNGIVTSQTYADAQCETPSSDPPQMVQAEGSCPDMGTRIKCYTSNTPAGTPEIPLPFVAPAPGDDDAGDASEEKTDVGGIVGAVLASLLGLCWVGAGVVVCKRQCKKEKLIPAVPTVELFVSTTGGINSFNPLEKLENDP